MMISPVGGMFRICSRIVPYGRELGEGVAAGKVTRLRCHSRY